MRQYSKTGLWESGDEVGHFLPGQRFSPRESIKSLVGVPGIEPGHFAPKANVLPVYDTPTKNFIPRKRTPFRVSAHPTRFFEIKRFGGGI
jgi:hypothetical protein